MTTASRCVRCGITAQGSVGDGEHQGMNGGSPLASSGIDPPRLES